MDEKEFKKLVKKNKYQIFLFSCPAPIPINFAIHCWFVTNYKGKVKRWDLLDSTHLARTQKETYHEDFLKGKKVKILSKRSGCVYQDILPPTPGVNKYYWKPRPLSKGSLKKVIEGDDKSLAYKMISFIEKNAFKYKYKDTYNSLGPNSNTFIQWIIDKFLESGFELGWRAIGKNYKK